MFSDLGVSGKKQFYQLENPSSPVTYDLTEWDDDMISAMHGACNTCGSRKHSTEQCIIFINCTSSVETITEPDLFICAKDSPPTVELLLQTKCPHFFMHDHHTDQTAPHYGLVIATPASVYSDIMVSDLSHQFIPYP